MHPGRAWPFREGPLLALLAVVPMSEAGGAVLTPYPTETALLAVLSGQTYETFDQMSVGTILTNQIPGVTFSSPWEGQLDYLPTQVFSSQGAPSQPNLAFGGAIGGSPEGRQTMVLEFAPGPLAFGFQLCDQRPSASPVMVKFDFADATSQTLSVGNGSESETTPNFFGVTSDTPISRVTLTAGTDFDDSWEEFGIDNLVFAPLTTTRVPATSWGLLKGIYR